MEYALKKKSELALIFFPLLGENYHVTKILIDKIKYFEFDEALKYHIERQSLKHSLFKGYSFLYKINGRYNNGKMIIKRNKKTRMRVNNNSGGVRKYAISENDKHQEIIKKYEEMLLNDKLTEEQKHHIKNMLVKRKNKIK